MLAAEDCDKAFLTFGFVVGKLMVGQAKPSLLEILHSEAVSPLCSLYHEPEKRQYSHMKVTTRPPKSKQMLAGIYHSVVSMLAFGCTRSYYSVQCS